MSRNISLDRHLNKPWKQDWIFMAIPIDGIFSVERKALSKEGTSCQAEVPSSNTPNAEQVTKVKRIGNKGFFV